MAPAQPNAWAAFWQVLIKFEKEKVYPWLALRNTAGVTLPLAIGAVLGTIHGALPIATGALNVGFIDSYEPYPLRASRMLAASVLVAGAVFAGSFFGANHAVAILIATAWAFAAGLLVSLSAIAADLGVISLVTLIVFAAAPMPIDKALSAALLAFCGGLIQMSLALFFWPIRRYGPERRLLGDLYLEISRTAAAPAPGSIDASQEPPASAQSFQAHSSMAAVSRNLSVDAERYWVLLSQAERMRLGLLTLRRIRSRIRRENADSTEAPLLDRFFEIYSAMLDAISNTLIKGDSASFVPDGLTGLQKLSDRLRAIEPPSAALIDARIQMDALTGQLRTAYELSTSATPQGLEAFQRREARQPWDLRLIGTFATLRANLSLHSAAFRHGVRLAVCIAVGDTLARSLGLQRAYWVPMTIAIVLKPDFTATFSRGVLRLIGTFVGLVFATGLFHFLPASTGIQVALVAVSMFMLRCYGAANYGLLVMLVTSLVVFLFALLGFPPKEVMAARAANTVVGGIIALIAYWAWPTWERTQAPEALALMLDGYRDYFRSIRESYLRPGDSLQSELDRSRLASRLSRSNLIASMERLFAEPGTSADTVNLLGTVVASSHRLAHALMALEAGLTTSHPAPPREAFLPFANDVEMTLYYQAAALRRSPIKADVLPDLREDHYKLVNSGDALTERYALVNVETDRITNSLNTMSEALFRWLALRR